MAGPDNQYGTYEKQRELLEMIKDLDLLFAENNIKYSLSDGSLIGAVRENGFIPWDDDIDIMVDRYNHNKILRLFQKGDVPKFRLTRYMWVYRIQKKKDNRRGLKATTIDIFVVDNCPDSFFARKMKVLALKTLQGMMHKKLVLNGKNLLMKVCLIVTYGFGRVFSDRYKFYLYNRISQFGNNKKTKYVTSYNDTFDTLNCRYKNVLMKNIIRHKFEDTMLPITKEYDNYLSVLYGDYMTPPEIKDRVPPHEVTF